MKRLKSTEIVVEKILDMRKDTRESDDILYLCVCEFYHRGVSSMSFKDFLKLRKQTGCLTFETVRRTRQKVFERRPELKPEKITKLRKEAEKEYIDYAING